MNKYGRALLVKNDVLYDRLRLTGYGGRAVELLLNPFVYALITPIFSRCAVSTLPAAVKAFGTEPTAAWVLGYQGLDGRVRRS